MTDRYFVPRLRMLAMLIILAVLARILDPWPDESLIDFELTAASDASLSLQASSVDLSLKFSISPPDFQAGALQ